MYVVICTEQCATDSGLVLEVGLLSTVFLPGKKKENNKKKKHFFCFIESPRNQMAVLLFSIIQRCVAPRLSPDYSFRKGKKNKRNTEGKIWQSYRTDPLARWIDGKEKKEFRLKYFSSLFSIHNFSTHLQHSALPSYASPSMASFYLENLQAFLILEAKSWKIIRVTLTFECLMHFNTPTCSV